MLSITILSITRLLAIDRKMFKKDVDMEFWWCKNKSERNLSTCEHFLDIFLSLPFTNKNIFLLLHFESLRRAWEKSSFLWSFFKKTFSSFRFIFQLNLFIIDSLENLVRSRIKRKFWILRLICFSSGSGGERMGDKETFFFLRGYLIFVICVCIVKDSNRLLR